MLQGVVEVALVVGRMRRFVGGLRRVGGRCLRWVWAGRRLMAHVEVMLKRAGIMARANTGVWE